LRLLPGSRSRRSLLSFPTRRSSDLGGPAQAPAGPQAGGAADRRGQGEGARTGAQAPGARVPRGPAGAGTVRPPRARPAAARTGFADPAAAATRTGGRVRTGAAAGAGGAVRVDRRRLSRGKPAGQRPAVST